jgi:hypothetical protein
VAVLAFAVHSACAVKPGVFLLFASALLAPQTTLAYQEIAGTPAVVALAPAAVLAPTRYREHMVFTDRVTTGDRTFARLLLGGRVMVLARAGSALSITEVGAALTIEVETGRLAVTVDRGKLEPDELVEIRTPHAAVSVPSETLVVEVVDEASTFRVHGTRMDVFRLDPVTGEALEPPTSVAAEQVVTVVPFLPITDVAAASAGGTADR